MARGAMLCMLIVGLAVAWGCGAEPRREARPRTRPTYWVRPRVEREPEFQLLINCGATEPYTDSQGRLWQPDQAFAEGRWGYVGGTGVERFEMGIERTDDAPIYLTERFGASAYRIPVQNGRYRVRLHFAETYWEVGAPGVRVYTVLIEGRPVLKDFDPYEEAGLRPNVALMRQSSVRVRDGELTIEFEEGRQNPMINGIEVSG